MIRPITAEETIELRWPILRAGLPRESAIFPGDELPTPKHFGAFDDTGRMVGVVSIYLAQMPEKPEISGAWQLRGMATIPEVRGHGHGKALVAECERAAAEAGSTLIWCNARTPAAPFYARCGWEIIGEEFDIPTAGPHYRMWHHLPNS